MLNNLFATCYITLYLNVIRASTVEKKHHMILCFIRYRLEFYSISYLYLFNLGKGLKNTIRKLEQRIMELESDLDTQTRAAAEQIKNARKSEKKVKELTFQIEDDGKAVARAQDATEKLNQKCKKMRLQLEEAENQAAQWQSKYKKAAVELEEAEERSEAAEQALQKARQRARAGASTAGTRGVSKN